MAPTVSIWRGRAVGTRSRTHGSARESLLPPAEHGLHNLCPSTPSNRTNVVKVVDRRASIMQTYSQAEVSERKGANKHGRKSPRNKKKGIGRASCDMVLSPRICPFDRAHTRMHALHH